VAGGRREGCRLNKRLKLAGLSFLKESEWLCLSRHGLLSTSLAPTGSPPAAYARSVRQRPPSLVRRRMLTARCRLAAWIGVLTITAACERPRTQDERGSADLALAAAQDAASQRFDLISVDSLPLPQHDSVGWGEPCDKTTYAGWYELTGDNWKMGADYSSTCPAISTGGKHRVVRDSGRVRRRGDTLTFVRFDPHLGDTLEIQEALLRRDTLRAALNPSQGPRELYVRRRLQP
jgi:hypothetical protein